MTSLSRHLVTHRPAYAHANERGAALIVVLLFLILIMLAGVMAVRQSSNDLKVATADQVNTLLLQGADGAHIKLEGVLNGETSSLPYQQSISGNGIFGYFMMNLENNNDELIYCYNPRIPQYLTKNTTILRGTGSVMTGGYCDPTKSSNYLSDRQTVLTQMSIKPASSATAGTPFSAMPEGRSVDNTAIKKYKFDTRSIAALPAYNDPSTCFQKSSIGTDTVLSCLKGRTVPTKQIYEQIDVDYAAESTKCVPFGRGTGTSTTPNYESTKCVLATE